MINFLFIFPIAILPQNPFLVVVLRVSMTRIAMPAGAQASGRATHAGQVSTDLTNMAHLLRMRSWLRANDPVSRN